LHEVENTRAPCAPAPPRPGGRLAGFRTSTRAAATNKGAICGNPTPSTPRSPVRKAQPPGATSGRSRPFDAPVAAKRNSTDPRSDTFHTPRAISPRSIRAEGPVAGLAGGPAEHRCRRRAWGYRSCQPAQRTRRAPIGCPRSARCPPLNGSRALASERDRRASQAIGRSRGGRTASRQFLSGRVGATGDRAPRLDVAVGLCPGSAATMRRIAHTVVAPRPVCCRSVRLSTQRRPRGTRRLPKSRPGTGRTRLGPRAAFDSRNKDRRMAAT